MENQIKTIGTIAIAFLIGTADSRAQGELVLTSGSASSGVINAVGGVATYDNTVGGWSINVTTGLAGPTEPAGSLDLNSIDFTGTGTPAPLVILWSGDANAPAGQYVASVGGTMSSGVGATFETFYNPLPTSTPVPTVDPLTAPMFFNGSPFAGSSTGVAVGPGPFSLTEEVIVTSATSADSLASFDFNLTPVPEPSSVVLLLSGGAALIARRFKRGSLGLK